MSHLEVIPYDECIELLTNTEVGRLGLISEGEPMVVPVNYLWDGSAVVLRSDPGRKVTAAPGQVVVFEIDRLDRAAEEGWSVIVRGLCRLVEPDAEQTSLRAWAPGAKANWLRIEASTVSGRRIRHDDDLADEWWRLAASS